MNKAKVAAVRTRKAITRRRRNGPKAIRSNGANGGNGAVRRNGRDGSRRYNELEAAIQRYADLYEFAPFGYVSFDRSGRIEQINLAACQLLGAKRDNLLRAPFSLCVVPEHLDLFLNHLVRCRAGNHRVETSLRLKKRGGEALSVFLSSTPTKDFVRDGGQVYQTAIVDLTERDDAEQALQRSEERYRTLFDLVPVAVYACDENGVIREYNRRATELWGRELGRNGEEPRFCGSYKLYYPDGRRMPHEKCPMARALRGEKLTPKDLEIVIERPNGDRRHVISAPRILKNERGKIVGAINCLYDITERKKTEQELQLASRLPTENPAPIMRLKQGRIVSFANPAAKKLLQNFGVAVGDVAPPEITCFAATCERTTAEMNYGSHTYQIVVAPVVEGDYVNLYFSDVADRKRAEDRFRLAVESSPNAMVMVDHAGKIVLVNTQTERVFGYKRDELIGQSIEVLVPERFRGKRLDYRTGFSAAPQARAMGAGRDLYGLRKDGSEVPIEIGLNPIQTGAQTLILSSIVDITERKRAEEQQEALYQFVQRQNTATSISEIYEAALDAILGTLRCDRASILLFDEKKVIRFVAWRDLSERYRKAVETHLPWKADAKNPQPICFADVDLADIPKSLKAAIKAEGIRAAAFIPLMTKRKLIGKFMTYYDAPHVFNDAEVNLAVTVARQLVLGIEHQRAREAVRESEARMRAIVEQATAGMARCDTAGRMIFVNQRFAEMLGYDRSELIGKTIREMTHPDDAGPNNRLFERMIRDGKPFEIEKRYLRKDGTVLWADVSASAVKDENGKTQSAVAVVVDVTARKTAETALKRSKRLLEKLVQQRTKALRVANAELENEITRRKGLEGQILEISDREQEKLGQELHDGLCQQLTAIGFLARATALRLKDHRVVQQDDLEKIAQLINSSVMDARNIARDLHKEEIEAAEFPRALQDLVERKIWQTSCRLDLKTEMNIENDNTASQLYRILREAVINANKHARATQIVLEVRRLKNELVFSVTDNGVGLNTKIKTGHGLGFHIMKYRAESIGARLEFESLDKGGTCVACYLPIERSR